MIVTGAEEAYDYAADELWLANELMGVTVLYQGRPHLRIDPRADGMPWLAAIAASARAASAGRAVLNVTLAQVAKLIASNGNARRLLAPRHRRATLVVDSINNNAAAVANHFPAEPSIRRARSASPQ